MANFSTVITKSGRGFNAEKEGVYFEVEGLEKALKKLKRLQEIDRKKARQFKAGIKKAANPLVEGVKTSIESDSGSLKKSIAFIPSKKKGALLGYVGARFGKRARKTFDGYYAAIVNYGLPRGKSKTEPTKRDNVNYVTKGWKKGGAQTKALLLAEVQKILKKSLFELSR